MRKVETVTLAGGRKRYKVRFRHDGRESSERFDTKREAQQFVKWLDALGPQGALDQMYTAEQSAHVPTLDRLAADHFEHLTGITDGYRLRSARLWARTWSPLIGHMPANVVTRDAVAKALNTLAVRYKRKSLMNQRGQLAGVLDRAIEHGYLARNPTKRMRLPEGRQSDGAEDEMVCLTADELDVLLRHVAERWRPLVRFLVGTGARWGEVVALRKMDCDLDAAAGGRPQPVVRIRRALKDSPDGRRVIGAPKSKKSRRTIVLPAEVAADLRSLLEGKAGDDLVFTAPRGGMVQHRTFWSDHWRPAVWRAQHCADHVVEGCRCGTAHPKRCKEHKGDVAPPCGCAGTLTQDPRIHDLRHTHASWLLARGVPIHVVSARLGHESIQTTVDTYGHLLPDAQLQAAQAASMAFERPPEIGPSGNEPSR